MDENSLMLFANTLSGAFDNLDQSQNNSKNFARIIIYFRPLPWEIFKGPWIYSEQSYEYDKWRPYRQGLHEITKEKTSFILSNYILTNKERIAGAGFKPELLQGLENVERKQRLGCSMCFKQINPGNYIGELKSLRSCLIPWEGKMTYLKSKVNLSKDKLICIDEGFDIRTNDKVWGSVDGPLIFNKVKDFSEQITKGWQSK